MTSSKPYISDHDFRSSNNSVDDVCYKLYVFDIRYQEKCKGAQPFKAKFNFDGVVPSNVNDYALLMKSKLVSISFGEQKHFDSISVILFNLFITTSFSYIVNFVLFNTASLYFSKKICIL